MSVRIFFDLHCMYLISWEINLTSVRIFFDLCCMYLISWEINLTSIRKFTMEIDQPPLDIYI